MGGTTEPVSRRVRPVDPHPAGCLHICLWPRQTGASSFSPVVSPRGPRPLHAAGAAVAQLSWPSRSDGERPGVWALEGPAQVVPLVCRRSSPLSGRPPPSLCPGGRGLPRGGLTGTLGCREERPCADQQTQGPGSHRRHPRSAARVWDGLPGRPEGRTGPARGRLTGGCALSLCALLRGAGARRATAPCLCKSRRARRLLERSASFGNSPLGQREERFGDSENAMTSALPRARLCR